MNQQEKLLELFRFHGNRLTLGQLLANHMGVGYKATSRFSDLRKKGYSIICEKHKDPSDNVYRLTPPEESGQTRFA